MECRLWRPDSCALRVFWKTIRPCVSGVQLRHRHVLVEEYQEVNRASARLLKMVAEDGERLWVVGDARQSIYRFRGTSSENMVRFSSDYAAAVMDQLGVNYRSTEEIVHSLSRWRHIWARQTACCASNWRPIGAEGQAIPSFAVSRR